MICPVSQIELIEDMEYRTSVSQKETRSKQVKRTCSTEEKVKKTKVAKVKEDAPAVPAGGGVMKPLTGPQKEAMTKNLKELNTWKGKLEDTQKPIDAKTEPWVEFLAG